MNALEYLIETAEKGGVVLLPIFLVSAWAWYLVLQKWHQLRNEHFPHTGEEIRMLCSEIGEMPEEVATKRLSRYSGVYRTCVEMILRNRDRSESWVRNRLNQVLMEKWPAIERHWSTISSLAAIAPLLGLLGTVTGMIHTFQMITLFGSGNPVLMAGGISEALLTTQSGLVVAFPLLICLSALQNRARLLQIQLESTATAVLNVLYRSHG